MASENPYQVLGIQPNASINEIEDAFTQASAPFDVQRKLSASETKTFQRIHDAYDTLMNTGDRDALDQKLLLSNLQGQVEIPLREVSTRDDAVEEPKPLSREKTLGQKPTSNALKTMFMVFAAFFGLIFVVNLVSPKNKPKEVVDEAPVAAAYTPTVIPLMTDDDLRIINNIKYPNPSIFGQPIIYAPNGSIMPTQAGLIPNMPVLSDGRHSLIIKNPRQEAVFGKVLFRSDENDSTTVIRYFYIPMLETLTLIRLPAGQYQVQILTLVKPTAYVSPQFSFSVSDENSNTIATNWDYPYPAARLF